MFLIMSQFILPEMEHRYPKDALVSIKEEPWILQRIEVAHDMEFSGRRVALSTHDGDLLTLACYINHYQRMPHALNLSCWINEDIAWLHITYRAWLCLPAYRERAAHTVSIHQEFLQRLA